MRSIRVHVTGIVQGVGFRPFVYGLAVRLGLRGWVLNTSAGVDIHVEGAEVQVALFIEKLSSELPPLATLDSVTVKEAEVENHSVFTIQPSNHIEGAFQPVSPDVALCADCERELFDPQNRRYLYPFINCTNCGPRFTIIKDLPYDRPATTMADFPLCEDCRAEYENPTDRRFHAQPVACPTCGPFVQLRSLSTGHVSNIELRLSAVLKTRQFLREGRVVAIKGLGGFHLACDAMNERAVNELRQRKGRAGKPFALMFANLDTVMQYCEINEEEAKLLTGHEKPIVLLKLKAHTSLAANVAPHMDTLGAMLPYTPLHHLILNQTDEKLNAQSVPPVLVMTSGNLSEEPISITNEDAFEKLSPLADAFLLHNRDIHVRCDDSVVRADGRGITFLRRARGYAPYPVLLPFESRPTLAVGGELKNTFCLTRDRYAFLSQHIGDMENVEVYESFEQNVERLSHLFRVQPQVIAHDMHPNYFTTQWAQKMEGRRVPVQHHHAHIAACMADNRLTDRRVIGLSFDGTGYGTDGAIWGGEVLLASYADFERVAHLQYLPLPGSDSATRHPWRIAVGYAEALGLEINDLPFMQGLDATAVEIVRQQVRKDLNTPHTSSMGRLFDAVASLGGVRSDVSYEAQAAIELEVLSKRFINGAEAYPYQIRNGIVLLGELLQDVIADIRSKQPVGLIGARFHQTLCALAVEVCRNTRNETGINEVALSGGVWQNQTLLNLTREKLADERFVVFSHRQTPANDGGLALGQAVIANYSSER
ncbi:MAG TPA: carbamoyltransferase HypF [Anaerolineales bacterium]|nr:carbamoyltransferase HypF [Anaerolineales bacterium]HNH06492.1 carbamoyltransferase HypF [Anaerolineales bacterium]HNH80373.1 carbamoyltransferase HypF [Anaerolineales bacterium]HNO84596.1 carbamoyltransferase HypF [Anaerolineales bacterium]